jgi:SAM-dependent methyltransferase
MSRCQCEGVEAMFNPRLVRGSLARYRKQGPAKTTRLLTDAVRAAGVDGATLLDIGGGLGAIEHTLLAAGVTSATDVDASSAYLEAAQEEAARRGMADRIIFRKGNFVDLAPEVPKADIVTLDRVLCCYDDVRSLARLSAQHAKRLYAVVYPRDEWWSRLFGRIGNILISLTRSQFRLFVHSQAEVEGVLRKEGFTREYYRRAGFWQVAVFARQGTAHADQA